MSWKWSYEMLNVRLYRLRERYLRHLRGPQTVRNCAPVRTVRTSAHLIAHTHRLSQKFSSIFSKTLKLISHFCSNNPDAAWKNTVTIVKFFAFTSHNSHSETLD